MKLSAAKCLKEGNVKSNVSSGLWSSFLCSAFYSSVTFVQNKSCTLSPSQTQTPKLDSIPPSSLAGIRSEDLDRDFNFDPEADRNVLVFLHIQKTGGTTFGRYLVKNTDISEPCVCYKHRKRCDCRNSKNHIWLFSRYSTGWACGLHADWTELHDCVPKVLDDKGRRSQSEKVWLFVLFSINSRNDDANAEYSNGFPENTYSI